jgi:hypothetical protein
MADTKKRGTVEEATGLFETVEEQRAYEDANTNLQWCLGGGILLIFIPIFILVIATSTGRMDRR